MKSAATADDVDFVSVFQSIAGVRQLLSLEGATSETPKRKLGHDEGLTRACDIIIALLVIVLIAPLLIMLMILVRTNDGGPALFSQRRIGRGGRTFACYKFRSMAPDAEARLAALLAEDVGARLAWARDHKLRDDPRVTSLGAFLRRSSLDELPQLFNVLSGDMSLVGPRPIVGAEITRYGFRFQDYCSVRPGITGLWQISGRNDVSYQRRVAMDVVYARRRDLRMYLAILVGTIPSVLLKRGAY